MKIRRHIVRALCLLGLWLGLGLQAHAQTDTVTYVYTDPQGTPLVKADASGNVIAKYDYTPYGNSIASLGAAPNGPGYTGHVNDPETGLVYMQARYYQPTGRFLSPDPLGPNAGDVFGFNRYAYADNNPIVRIDLDGRQSCGSGGCTVGPTPYNFFRDNFIGNIFGRAIGDPIALGRSDSYNPLTNEYLDRGQIQEAKLGVLMLAVPASKPEEAVAEALKPMARGIAAEVRVLAEMGLTKNSEAVATTEGKAVPDALTSTLSVEIKDTIRVSATRQVRIQTSAAAQSGRESVLVTGTNTHVTPQATQLFDRIIRRDDLGPQQ